jgi:hypothetical protein
VLERVQQERRIPGLASVFHCLRSLFNGLCRQTGPIQRQWHSRSPEGPDTSTSRERAAIHFNRAEHVTIGGLGAGYPRNRIGGEMVVAGTIRQLLRLAGKTAHSGHIHEPKRAFRKADQ